ncbi:hypothetical protein [Microvirga sp. M2]|uniref:hypothetical protein n=1 Tax=Microvirga sp. M2 TaxID=3073270 RepID=UPI0039C3025E
MRFSRWFDRVISDAEANGWVVTFSGRCFVIPKKAAPEKSDRMADRTGRKAPAKGGDEP